MYTVCHAYHPPLSGNKPPSDGRTYQWEETDHGRIKYNCERVDIDTAEALYEAQFQEGGPPAPEGGVRRILWDLAEDTDRLGFRIGSYPLLMYTSGWGRAVADFKRAT